MKLEIEVNTFPGLVGIHHMYRIVNEEYPPRYLDKLTRYSILENAIIEPKFLQNN